MEYRLMSAFAVAVQDVDSVESAVVDVMFGNQLSRLHHLSKSVGLAIENVYTMLLWNDKRMSECVGSNVQKGVSIFVLIYFATWNLPFDYFTKNAIFVHNSPFTPSRNI